MRTWRPPSNFYPRSPRGERRGDQCPRRRPAHFYPRSPRGERPTGQVQGIKAVTFLSTLPARGATGRLKHLDVIQVISIHAPREGSDQRLSFRRGKGVDFYPRSPRGERPEISEKVKQKKAFLSTLPARGATIGPVHRGDCMKISIHAPREGSDVRATVTTSQNKNISIHAPREGSDSPISVSSTAKNYFYPRSPRGERPVGHNHRHRNLTISIHAPREGSDLGFIWLVRSSCNFYPRSPRGERQGCSASG